MVLRIRVILPELLELLRFILLHQNLPDLLEVSLWQHFDALISLPCVSRVHIERFEIRPTQWLWLRQSALHALNVLPKLFTDHLDHRVAQIGALSRSGLGLKPSVLLRLG